MRWLLIVLLAGVASASAGEVIKVCFNYGCLAESEVHYADEQLAQVRSALGGAANAAEERQQLSLAIGWLLAWAGRQTPIVADRGGNTADDGVYGRMDCIDHSTTTSRLLRLLETRGWLRFHRVIEPVSRVRYLFQVHYSAQIEEVVPAGQASGELAEPARYVVDTWFRDNGRPAVVMTLQRWLAGDDENGEGKEEAAAAAAGESVSDSHGER